MVENFFHHYAPLEKIAAHCGLLEKDAGVGRFIQSAVSGGRRVAQKALKATKQVGGKAKHQMKKQWKKEVKGFYQGRAAGASAREKAIAKVKRVLGK